MIDIDKIKKWYNRAWSEWVFDYDVTWTIPEAIVLKRTSNDGLVEYKRVYKK